MFPSTGHFRSLHCPFHLEGRCGRIYCHFRHVKDVNEKSVENATLTALEDQICKDLKLDKKEFNILANEEEDDLHENLLNDKLKRLFPGCDELIDGFYLPENSAKDSFEFTASDIPTDETSKDLINLTEQDDTPLDEGPLKQFLEEDAKRNSSSEQRNPNTLEKRHIIISCLEKIDKREFSPRRVGVVQPRKFVNASLNEDGEENNIECDDLNDISTQPADVQEPVKIKQEDDGSESSGSEDNAEVDNILTQMELLNPQLFSSSSSDCKPEPVFDSFEKTNELNFCSQETVAASQNAQFSSEKLPVRAIHAVPRIKSVQAINNEIAASAVSTSDRPKPKKPGTDFFPSTAPSIAASIPAATIAEQNRLKNVFKNTICANIDQFFDLCDACKVYGTEIFNLLEPLLNFVIEKLNPEFNYEKLRQLHSQNMSLSCSIPFVSSCDHVINCVECHNILRCALSKTSARKVDKGTETLTSNTSQVHQDTPLRKIEAGLYDITKEIISLGIPMKDNEIIATDAPSASRPDTKYVRCQTDSSSRSKRDSSRDSKHSDRKHGRHDTDKHRSKDSKVTSHRTDKKSESRQTSSERRSRHSHSEHKSSRSSKSSHSHEKKRKDDTSEEETSDEDREKEFKRRRSSSNREHESKKHSTSDKHSSESRKRKSEHSSKSRLSHERDPKRSKSVDTVVIDSDSDGVENGNNSDDDVVNAFGSGLSADSSSDLEEIAVDMEDKDEESSEDEEGSKNKDDFVIPSATISAKKRVSHVTENNVSLVRRKEVVKKNLPSPSEVLFQRMQQAKKLEEIEPVSNLFNSSNDRVRISHVPNVALILQAKAQLKNDIYQRSKPVAPVRTAAQTTAKGNSRIAHVPTDLNQPKNAIAGVASNRPVINSYKSTNNIPLPTRQGGLDRLYNAFAKKVPPELASELALKEEKAIHEKVTITKVYLNSMAMAVHRISKEDPAKLIEKNTEFPTELNGYSTYDLLSKYILTYEQLEINGFPLDIPSQPGYCMISTKAVHYKPLASKRCGDRFYCQQCKDLFDVDPETGMPLTASPGCRFHLLRPRKEPGRTRHDMFYPCCNRSISEPGCVSAEHHTPDTTDDDLLEGFIETREAPPGESNDKTFYSLDCEMCYTTAGSELTRVTVIGPDCTTVYDSLVKPRNRILDYCTKFSGITEEKLRSVTKTLEQVRQELFKFIFKDTILIGHSLENDLKALKILHYNIVDTSVMYPHRDAPERKYALKHLSSNLVHYLIQESEFGHDSKEDALACMKLVWKKIREDAQVHKPKKIIGSPERSK